jgi:hypothetical protein
LLIIARKANPATARLGQFVMTGLMIEMVRHQITLILALTSTSACHNIVITVARGARDGQSCVS